MAKKAMILVVLLAITLYPIHGGPLRPSAQAEPYYFGTIKTILPAGSEGGYGLGGSFDFGLPLGDQIILRGTYESNKVDDGTGYDNVYSGFTVMSNVLIPKVRTGIYLTAQGGLSKVSGLPTEGATLSSMGFYSNIGAKTKAWLGFGYSEVADAGKLWSVVFSLSIQAPFE